jgi:hypothetical protein
MEKVESCPQVSVTQQDGSIVVRTHTTAYPRVQYAEDDFAWDWFSHGDRLEGHVQCHAHLQRDDCSLRRRDCDRRGQVGRIANMTLVMRLDGGHIGIFRCIPK